MAKANPTQSRVAPVSARLIILLDSEEMGGLWDDYGRWVGRGCMTAVAARAGMASVAQTRETSAVGGARRAGEAVDASRQSSSVMSRKRHSWALGTCTGAPEPRCG